MYTCGRITKKLPKLDDYFTMKEMKLTSLN